MPKQVVLVHGNVEEKVADCRYRLQREWLPGGEEDGEVVDIRSSSSHPLQLDKCAGRLIEELGTVSLVPDFRRVVVVYDLADLRTARRGSARQSAKKKASSADSALRQLEDYLTRSLPETSNCLLLVFHEDDEKGRRVEKTSALYELVSRLGEIREYSEKRLDWQFEDAVLSGDLSASIELLREWNDRGGGSSFRVVRTLNQILQLLLQARAREASREQGRSSREMFPPDMRVSLDRIPAFKAKKVVRLAEALPTDRLHDALDRLNQAQKAFFPTGREAVVHDPWETLEILLADLLKRKSV